MRYYCDMDGLGDNWIEVSPSWTRREVREMHEAEGPEFMDIWRRKVTACHLEKQDGEPITDPSIVTEDVLDDLDLRLLGFVGGVLSQATLDLRTLGNVSGRLSSNGKEPTMKPARPQPERN